MSLQLRKILCNLKSETSQNENKVGFVLNSTTSGHRYLNLFDFLEDLYRQT